MLDDLCTYFETIDIHQYANVVVVGDFNIDVSSTSHPLYHKLSCMMSTYALSQMVSGHTHVHHSDISSTIDLLFTSNPSLINDCITIPHSCQLVEKKSMDNLFSDNFAYTVNNIEYLQ